MIRELAGRVFDGTSLHEKSSVRFDSDSGIISAFGEKGSLENSENIQKLLDSQEITIIPGLIDAHVHFFGGTGEGIMDWATTPGALAALRSVSDLRKLLYAGYTAVRELGTKNGIYLAQAAEEGAFDSPTIVSCSRALAQTGGDDDPPILPLGIAQELASYSYFCDGPWDCRKAVRKVVRDGGKVVKIYASGGFAQGGKVRLQFTSEEIRAITDEAHRAGLKVAAHAYGEEALVNAVEGGADSIEHGLGLTPGVANLISERGICYIPTLITYSKYKNSGNKAREEMIRKHLTEDLAIAKEHKVKVVSGSDIVGDRARPHGRNYEEIEAEAKFLGNREALVAATSRAAECLGLEISGKIEQGYAADIAVVKGNPLDDIKALAPENILAVIKKGKVKLLRRENIS
jgi:imidazolonepropionase-like amidohydrolase